MRYHYDIVLKRWLPILEEYEKTKAKVNPRSFKFELKGARPLFKKVKLAKTL